MAALEVNRLLPLIAGGVVVLMGAAVFIVSNKDDGQTRVVDGETGVSINPLIEADADNTTDTIRALSGHVDKLKQSVTDVNEQNARLEQEKEKAVKEATAKANAVQAEMEARLRTITESNQAAQNLVLAEFKTLQETIGSLKKDIEMTRAETEKARKAQREAEAAARRAARTASTRNRTGADSPLNRANTEIVPGLGLGAATDGELSRAGSGLRSGSVMEGSEMIDVVWINPLDRPSAGGAGAGEQDLQSLSRDLLNERIPSARPRGDGLVEVRASARGQGVSEPLVRNTARKTISNTTSTTSGGQSGTQERTSTERYFTLPDLSMLTDAVALTSLVGRIAVDNDVNDPWPFKVMIRRDNLTANYTDLPAEIDGMLYEGYAVGDWTLSCVRGWITAATFVFADGTTVSAYSNTEGARPEASRFSQTAIGYLSDAYGNPCVKGLRVTDAPQFLASRSFAAGLAGYATALNAEAEEKRTSVGTDGSINTVTRVLEGSRDYASNAAFAEAFAEGANWVRERQQQSFDAVYVAPGESVVVNLQAELWLDKQPGARLVRYQHSGRKVHAQLD